MHQSVLLTEAVDALNVVEDGIYIDATFGRGGHAMAILSRLGPKGQLWVMDRDDAAIAVARQLFQEDKRVMILHDTFDQMAHLIARAGLVGKVDGVLFDLGVSSPQLDDAERGFSFLREGPLDMRMDRSQTLTAEAWLHQVPEKEMVQVFRTYGEERFAGRIARTIVERRNDKRITTTTELAEIIKAAHPAWEKNKHPATRCFQAIRIVVNDEFSLIEKALASSVDALKIGGRLVVIAFHSLEDHIVKSFIQAESVANVPDRLPVMEKYLSRRLKKIGKVIRAQSDELDSNIRARSALLRIAEKVGDWSGVMMPLLSPKER